MPCNHASTPMQSYKSNMQPCNHATPSIHATMQVQAIRAMQPCKSKHAMQSCKSNMQPCNHATPSIHATMQVQACHAMQPCKSKHACHACHAIMQSKHARHAIIKSMHGMHENPSMPHACKTMHAALAPFSMPCARNKNISNLQEKNCLLSWTLSGRHQKGFIKLPIFRNIAWKTEWIRLRFIRVLKEVSPFSLSVLSRLTPLP